MFWARAGILYNLVFDKLDFIFTLGGGVPVKGDPWKSFFMGNALLNVHAGPAYVAGGLGFSTKETGVASKGGIDLVGELGINLFRSNDSIGSIFGELRAPVITKDRPFRTPPQAAAGFPLYLLIPVRSETRRARSRDLALFHSRAAGAAGPRALDIGHLPTSPIISTRREPDEEN